MLQAIQQRIYQGLFLEQLVPVRIIQICRDNCCLFDVALSPEFKERIDLFRFERQLPQFVNQQYWIVTDSANKLWGRSVGQ